MNYLGEEVGVYAPATGTVHWGFKIPGAAKEEVEFRSDDVLGFVKATDGEEWDIRPDRLGYDRGVVYRTLYDPGEEVIIAHLIALMKVTYISA